MAQTGDVDYVMICTCWRLFQQLHIVMKAALATLDEWPHADAFPVAYFAGAATLSNLWRGPGAAE